MGAWKILNDLSHLPGAIGTEETAAVTGGISIIGSNLYYSQEQNPNDEKTGKQRIVGGKKKNNNGTLVKSGGGYILLYIK